MNLSQLRPGESARVTGIEESPLRRRLRDLGLTDGTTVECVMKSPLGDPWAYRFRGTTIAMRKKDARTVQVSYGGQ